ncbi:MAG TPA: GNAT family N-acetyltransferase [Thermoanaerobaculia bacterium]|jgi:GNAT superfamily N-acetyltransferase|nr:GNAT family N-acetyltransferase [Thermoanaerobaculia bacterium]
MLDDRTIDKRVQLKRVADAYIRGLRTQSFETIPFHPHVTLRAPIVPGGVQRPIHGRDAVHRLWWQPLQPLLPNVAVTVRDYFYNEALNGVVLEAYITLSSGLPNPVTAHVADRFTIDEDGLIIDQEHHSQTNSVLYTRPMPSSSSDEVVLVTYRPELQPEFERLNRLWLERHSLLEPADLDYLQEPERHILAGGGQVFFAMQGETVMGTCAAICISATTVELAKLSVDASARGRRVGRRLCDVVLEHARGVGASEVVLTSNTALVDAIRLYEAIGFEHAPLPQDLRYETADVYMRLAL